MELLDEIARISKFSYIVDINPDGAYGVKNPVTGEWNGVVKQLMSHVSLYLLSFFLQCSAQFYILKSCRCSNETPRVTSTHKKKQGNSFRSGFVL